jgi:beta-mannosidase
MFSPQVYDVTDLLTGENRLAVRLVGSRWLPRDRSSPWEKLLNHVESRASSLSRRFPHRRDVLKCQMSFGWDFAPSLRTMGIWDDVYVVVSGDAFIRDAAAQQQWMGDAVALAVIIEVDAHQGRTVRLRCTLAGATFESEPQSVERVVELTTGISRHCVELAVSQPRLWWPWDHGRPDLYRLTTEVWEDDRLLDAHVRTVGLRHLSLEGWTFHVNGRPVYARGANWVPADILPGRVTEARYCALLNLARQANMNMLRVWGGGLREKRAFYDLCDGLGVLVWQEFPFACSFLTRFPRSPDYLRLVEAETRAIVRELRNHPSLVVWCGGNEFSPDRNAPLIATLRRVVSAEDPTRPFLPASPANGDGHNWRVWHDYEPPSTYRQDPALFASEFGLQSPPDVETLRRFLPPEDLWPPGRAWTLHGADLPKLERYARPFLQGRESSLGPFVEASQRAQAHGLQLAIEHYRRRKARGNGGVLLWQLNEPWPAISWALIDYYQVPKPAFDVVRRVLNPLLVSVDFAPKRFQAGDQFRATVWLINDRAVALRGCRLKVTLRDQDGQQAYDLVQVVDVPACSAAIVDRVCWPLPDGGDWRLECCLSQGSQLLSENEYDLAIHDGYQPALGQRLRAWLSGLVVSS